MNEKVAVLCWEESRPWVSALRQSGFSVPWVEEPRADVQRQVAATEPDLLLVDLTRTAAQGIATVGLLAKAGALSGIPVVLVGSGEDTEDLSGTVDRLTVTSPEKMIAAVKAVLSQKQKA